MPLAGQGISAKPVPDGVLPPLPGRTAAPARGVVIAAIDARGAVLLFVTER
jgi:hypothetical protein